MNPIEFLFTTLATVIGTIITGLIFVQLLAWGDEEPPKK